MSVPDYDHHAQDHQALLILVQQIGSKIAPKTFNKIYDKISHVQYVRIQDTQGAGGQRGIWLRYKKSYFLENNEWGDFQTHRKVLGLLCVGKYTTDEELQDLCKQHNNFQEKYSPTLFDSRCLVFGSDSTSNNSSAKESEDEQSPSSPTVNFTIGDQPTNHAGAPDVGGGGDNLFESCVEPLAEEVDEQSCDREASNGHEIPCEQTTNKDDLTRESSETSLASTPSSSDSPSVQMSPASSSPATSRKLMIPPTVKSRSTQCILYPGTDYGEQLVEDLHEFVSSLFWVLESKRLDRSYEKQDKIPLLLAPFEKKDIVGLDMEKKYKKKSQGRMRKHVGDLSLQSGLPVEALTMYSAAVDILKSSNDWLWLAAAYEGQCAATIVLLHPSQSRSSLLQRICSYPVRGTNATKPKVLQTRSLPNGLDPADYKALGRNILSMDEITEKYWESLSYYSKFSAARVISTECSVKATRVHILLERYLIAADFLQNVVYSNLQQSDEEKVGKFCALSQLYTELGFHRKAAFFKRVAAKICCQNISENANWSQAYHLLLETLDGYRLTLDPKDFLPGVMNGWPGVQVQVLQELVGTAKRMGNQPVAVRHLCFLLHSLFEHLTPAERKEFCSQLESLTAKCEGAPVPLLLDTGQIIPAVNLLNLPQVTSYKLLPLAPHLRPVKRHTKTQLLASPDMGPFIFTPLQMKKERSTKTNKLEFQWVEGDVCEVFLQVSNPLPFDLCVSHMGLTADGVAFQSFPSFLLLPPKSNSYLVKLLGTPRGTGELQLLGYTTHVLGVKSNCRLWDLPSIKKPYYAVEVIPALPELQVSTNLPKASIFSSFGDSSHVVISAAINMYSGESRECTVTVMNTGKHPVEQIDISVHTKLDKALENQFFSWSKENLDTQLPIAPNSSASFTLYIHVVGGFLHAPKEQPVQERNDCSSPSHRVGGNKGRHPCSPAGGSPAGSPRQNNNRKVFLSPEPYPAKVIEAIVQLQYTGGPGMGAEFCRQCAISLTIEVSPSVLITKWDVIPAEVATYCYLVLDILNATAYEMELHYSAKKQMLIEARDTCRIPVPVERLPIHHKANIALCQQHLVNLVDLQWTLPGIEISGKASIAEVFWTPSMLDIICMSPIQWDITLNGKPFHVEEELNFAVGEVIMLTTILQNTSDTALHSLCFFIQGYQDYQNGHRSYRLEAKRAIVGSDKVLIETVLPGERFSHQCGLIFFHAGVFKLDIQCSCAAYPGAANAVARATAARLHQPDQVPSHTWRCSPTIEVTVTDK